MKQKYNKWLLGLLGLAICLNAYGYDFASNGIYYNITSAAGKTVEVTYKEYLSPAYSGEITIPSSVVHDTASYKVTAVGNSAFDNCSALTGVKIPDGVAAIGDWAFAGCGSIADILIPGSVTAIGENAFYCCRTLVRLSIPGSVARIGKGAFEFCSRLEDVTIGNGVTSIGSYAFDGTPWLDNQADGLIYAGTVAYKYKGTMPGGTAITLRDGTMEIAGSAFNGCGGLTDILIPGSVTTIGETAFKDCLALAQIKLPDGAASISYLTFDGCSTLKAIWDCSTLPQHIDSYTFNGVDKVACDLYVPQGCENLYASAIGWCDFAHIKGFNPAGIAMPDNDAVRITTSVGEIRIEGAGTQAEVTVYRLAGQTVYAGRAQAVSVPAAGLYLVKVGGKVHKVLVP